MKQDLEQYRSDIESMKKQGVSIREISKSLSEKANIKISSSAVFRYLKAEDSSNSLKNSPMDTREKADSELNKSNIIIKTAGEQSVKEQSNSLKKTQRYSIVKKVTATETPCAPVIPDDPFLQFLDERFGHMLPPDKHSWSYRIGGLRTALLKRFMLPRDVIIKHVDEYCQLKQWKEPQPEPQRIMKVSFNPPEERVSGPWI